MSVKALREYHGKVMLQRNLAALRGQESPGVGAPDYRGVLITPDMLCNGAHGSAPGLGPVLQSLAAQPHLAWLRTEKLVVKPDQLIKRRGKHGLVLAGCSFDEAKDWIAARMHRDVTLRSLPEESAQQSEQPEEPEADKTASGGVTGVLTHFLIEPFVAHKSEEERYVCIQSHRYYDEIYFHHQGGVGVGDVDSTAERLQIKTCAPLFSAAEVQEKLLVKLEDDQEKKAALAAYIADLYRLYREMHFCYLEINPLVVVERSEKDQKGAWDVVALDLAAKLDETAAFLADKRWGEVDFPPAFGRAEFPEEALIRTLDEKTGASLKLTVLNPAGRVWLMIAGGGASVVYADTVVDFGHGAQLANYGEYSGAPSAEETFQYASALFRLMLKNAPPEESEPGPVFLVGGGIANFTDVSATFGGLIKAISLYSEELRERRVTFWVRRAGLNFLEGLRRIKSAVGAEGLGLPIRVYGPETHMTAIVPMALGLMEPLPEPDLDQAEYIRVGGANKNAQIMEQSYRNSQEKTCSASRPSPRGSIKGTDGEKHPHLHYPERSHEMPILTADTRCIVYNLQESAVQRMLDFDTISGRPRASVAALVFPFGGRSSIRAYWGVEEVFIPVYTSIAEACNAHTDATVLVNFASFRSSFQSTMEALQCPQLRTIAIIAEGMPERQTREIIATAEDKGISIIGPATVGGIKPGAFRIGNTGGAMENLLMSRLYRPGSVAYVSRSGGMSNELNNIICRASNGVREGVAVGGDRYPGSRFLDHLLRYERDDGVKMMVLLGEVGGVDEYEVVDAVKDGRLTKPIVAWCVGTCASALGEETQFGHAGAQARGGRETARAKNRALRAVGVHVPETFDGLGLAVTRVFEQLKAEGKVPEKFEEPPVPTVPKDFTTLQKLGVARPKPRNIVSSISDDRGEEVSYGGMGLSEVLKRELGVGGALSLLWFKRNLPPACCRFFELVMVVCADHGPAVAGAHNTIVCARAGKDVVDSLCSGLLTIGPRFGGALDGAAKMFMRAFDQGQQAKAFVDDMKARSELILGIGHRVKSKHNPDTRVEVLKRFCLSEEAGGGGWSSLDPRSSVLGWALAVEEVTVKKKANLILNVDGAIAAGFVDMLRGCGAFSQEEVKEYVEAGALNGLFVLARSIGLIGHALDQRRLKQPLYRHPWEDIAYVSADNGSSSPRKESMQRRDSDLSADGAAK